MHPNEDALNAYADGSLTAAEAAEIEQHVASCVSCRQLVEDLREILRATADLDLQDPPARVWTRVERAIQLDGTRGDQLDARLKGSRSDGSRSDGSRSDGSRSDGSRSDGSRSDGSRSDDSRSDGSRAASRRLLVSLAAAAALVVATVVGLRYLPGRSQSAAPAGQAQGDSAQVSAQSIENELRQAEAHYENAIKGLEQIANAEQNALDPRTAATLQKNLAVIDQAISESRAAVRSQPASEPAQQSLIENFKTKIALLQDTVALINEMRKGNEAGAARIVSGLKQKGN